MLSIILPALNEEKAIGITLDRINNTLKESRTNAEVIVIDDGSKDRTAEIAKSKGVRVISHRVNLGYGVSLKDGFDSAKGDILCCIDADSTYPPEEIPKIYNYYLTHDVDMVVGSRLKGRCKGMPFIRKVGNKVLSRFAGMMLETRISDLTSGMRIISKKRYKSLLPLSNNLDFTVKMTLKCAARKMKVVEIPIEYDERRGVSKLSATKHGYLFLKTILHITRDYKPLKIFIPLSLFFISIGLISAISLFIRRILVGLSMEITNGIVIAGVLIIFGFQIFFFGIIADMIASKDE